MMIVGTFFPEHAGTTLFLLYVLGMLLAVASARLMRRFMFREQEAPFVMELSPYRVPTLRTTLRHMWSKCTQYIKKMGGLILIASIVVWLLSYYPRPELSSPNVESHSYEMSYMGKIGQVCEPLFRPMGFGWQESVAILSGIPAKEIVVSTMNVLYAHPDDADDGGDEELSHAVKARVKKSMSTPSAVAFLIFSLLYLPCIATIMAISSELNWKWAIGSALYNTAVAWLLAWVAYLLTGLLL
jgi:ferrous iron transport protein B